MLGCCPTRFAQKLPGKFTETAEIRGQNAYFAVQPSPEYREIAV